MSTQTGSAADVIERIGLGCGQWKALIAGGGVWLADGAELLLITSITKAVDKEWGLYTWEKGLIVSIVFFGVFIGNLLSGITGDVLGRRLPIITSYFGIVLFSLLSVLSTNSVGLCGTRFFVGVSFGLGQPCFNTFMGEITPSNHRMLMNAAAQMLFCGGELYSAMLIWWQDPLMQRLDWRWLVVMGAIPAMIFLGLSIFLLRESPSFLIVNGRTDEARAVLESIRDDNGVVDVDVYLPGDDSDTSGRSMTRRPSLTMQDKLGIVLGRHMLYSTLVVCVSVFTLNFLFYGGLYSFPQILPHMRLQISPSVNLMVGALVEFPGYALASVLGGFMPRKTLMLLYLLCVMACVLVFNFAGQHWLGPHYEMQIFVEAAFVGHKIFVSVGFLVVYVYAVEIYPTVARTMGASFCLAAGRIGAMTAPTLFESLVELEGSFSGFFCASAALCAINALLVLFLPYETKDIILADHPDERQPIVTNIPANIASKNV